MKTKFALAFMEVAETFAKLSTAKKLQVGAVIVKDNRIISIGYNGMPSGWTNECEHKDYMGPDAGGWLDADEVEQQWPLTEEYEVFDGEFIKDTYHVDTPGIYNPGTWTLNGKKKIQTRRYRMKSKPEVLHAETNAIAKVARSPESAEGATLFCTHTPCIECAKLIYQSGISEVYYRVEYHAARGAGDEFLKKCNVEVINI
jgi:dCMP deaminase